jgi:flagellar protein FliJ
MARFRFTLEPLLRLRRREEERMRDAFLSALRALRARELEAAELVRRREEVKARSRERQEGSIDIEELLRTRHSLNVLFQRIEEKRAELAALRPSLDGARTAYRRAAARRRVVEKVRERRFRDFLREEERRERRDLDEAAQTAFLRREPDGPAAAARGAER